MEPRFDPVEVQTRLLALEARLERLERRLGGEAPAPVAARAVGAPLVVAVPRPSMADLPARVSAAGPPASPLASPDLEATFGKSAFALLGAGFVAIALVVLTSLLLQRGYITREVQYGLAWLASAGFFGAGLLVERRGGALGAVLSGLGSLGAYLTAAAGWSTFGLYGDRVALGMVVVLALANLGYGGVKGGRAFLWLGLLGGTAAAVGAREHYGPSVVIGLVIALVAGAVAWRREWTEELWASWALGALGLAVTGASGGLLFVESQGVLRTLPLLLGTAFATPYLRRRSLDAQGFTGSGAVPVLVGAGAAWYGGASSPQDPISVAVLVVWTLFAGVLAWRTPDERNVERIGLGLAAFLTGGLALPATLPPRAHVLTLAGLAGLSALLSLRPSAFFRALGVAWLLAANVVWLLRTNTLDEGALSAGAAALALVLLAGVLREPRAEGGEWEEWGRDLVFGGAAFGYVAWALSHLAPRLGIISPTPKFALSGFALLLLGIVVGRKGLRYAGWPYIAVGVATVLFYDLSELDPALRIGLLLLFGLAALGVAAWYGRAQKSPSPESSGDGPT